MRFLQAGSAKHRPQITAALFALSSRVYDDLLPMLHEIELSNELHRVGALYVYRSIGAFEQDIASWETRRSFGIEAYELSGSEARALEPALARTVHCALLTPSWSHVSDPKRIVDELRQWLSVRGLRLVPGDVSSISGDSGGRAVNRERTVASSRWLATSPSSPRAPGPGSWRAPLETASCSRANAAITRHCRDRTSRYPARSVFAEHHFVATPMRLRIGGAAEDLRASTRPELRTRRCLSCLSQGISPELIARGQ